MRALVDGVPQLKCSVSARREVLIERDDGCERCSCRGTADEDDRNTVLKYQILAVACGALKNWRNRGDVARLAKRLWRGGEKNDRRSKVRQPNRGGLVCTLVRIERGISSPSG